MESNKVGWTLRKPLAAYLLCVLATAGYGWAHEVINDENWANVQTGAGEWAVSLESLQTFATGAQADFTLTEKNGARDTLVVRAEGCANTAGQFTAGHRDANDAVTYDWRHDRNQDVRDRMARFLCANWRKANGIDHRAEDHPEHRH